MYAYRYTAACVQTSRVQPFSAGGRPSWSVVIVAVAAAAAVAMSHTTW